jgi:hypothetical protein
MNESQQRKQLDYLKSVIQTRAAISETTVKAKIPSYQIPRSEKKIPSLVTVKCQTSSPKVNHYTGSAIVGIATMHKSNAIPVFSVEDAKDVSKMRRG